MGFERSKNKKKQLHRKVAAFFYFLSGLDQCGTIAHFQVFSHHALGLILHAIRL